MIDKIENWEKVQPDYGEYKKLPAGGYICQIIAVAIEKSKSGNDMITINYDIADGEYKGYFMNRYKNAPRTNGTEPKWQGKYYIVINADGYEARLKALTTSLEESNPGYTWDWNEQNIKNKIFGGIFREEEYLSNSNEIRSSCKLWGIRSVKTIQEGNFEIPRKKELSREQQAKYDETLDRAFDNNFTPVTDDDLPF